MGEDTSMKKLYLVNPSEQEVLDNAGDRIPLGLLNIASNARKRHAVKVFDLNHTPERDFRKAFFKDQPDAVGISVYTSPMQDEAIRLTKSLNGWTHTIAGGYHATAMPEALTPHFDAVVRGEGEEAIFEAMERKGVINGRNVRLSTIPDIRYNDLDMSRYGISQGGKRTGTVITSRGCPNDCSFCGKIEGNMRYEPVTKIRRQVKQLKDLGFKAVYFLDDVFTLRGRRMEEIIKSIDLPFRFTTRANMIDEGKLAMLADEGAELMSIGIESGNDEILKRVNKGMTTEQNRNAIRLANSYGIKTKGFFIIGLPGETEQTARQTIDFANELRQEGLNNADFYYLTPFPGTPIWGEPSKFGITINDRDFTKYLQAGKKSRCVIDTEELKAGRIEELVTEARQQWQ